MEPIHSREPTYLLLVFRFCGSWKGIQLGFMVGLILVIFYYLMCAEPGHPGLSLLEKSRPMLCMELHPHVIDPDKLVPMVRYLESLGYGLQHSYARMDNFPGLEHQIDTSPSTIEALLKEDGPIMQQQPWMAWFRAHKVIKNHQYQSHHET